jgi:hypothetical protein
MIRIMENDDAEQNEPLSKFTTLPERISVRLHKQLMPGEVIEFTLRSVVGSHTEGGFGGVKPGFSFGSARSGNVQNDQMGHPWLIITNQRLILVSKGLISFETRTFRFDQINSVELQQGILSDKLLIQGIGVSEVWEFRRKLRELSEKGAKYIQDKINKSISGKTSQPSGGDPMNELKVRLAKGEITLDEFNKLKDALK